MNVSPAPDDAPAEGRLPRPAPVGAPGDLLGAYELLAELARGGMGVVYRARHRRLGREVAIKLLLEERPDARERFAIEARAAARLRHPAIVAIHEVGQAGGRPYLVMDLVDGASLAALLERDGAVPPREVGRIGAEVAEALAYAHEQGVLHRDLKPANVLVDAAGRPRLTDFGLARVTEERGITVTGEVMGTPSYMAPEQAGGDRLALDRRTDVYGLGATLYALLTGAPPFRGPTALNVLHAVLHDAPLPPSRLRPGLDRDLETIVLRCLEKEPDRRYATARDVADDLGRYLRHEPIVARRPTTWGRLIRWARRHPVAARAAVGAGLLLPALAIGGAWWTTEREARARRRAEAEARASLLADVRRDVLAARAAFAALPAAASDDDRTAAALDALQATERWSDLARGDPEAARAHHEAALALGEVALASEQWALADHAFALAARAPLDDAGALERARAGRAQVSAARRAEAAEREAAVREVLAGARAGELRGQRDAFFEAAFQLGRHADERTTELICAELEAVAAQLEGGQELTRGEVDLARVCCESLGRLGRHPRAVEALARYLAAERDQLRAVPAGVALLRIGVGRETDAVHAARRRFGSEGAFSRRLAHAVGGRRTPGRPTSPPPDAARPPAADAESLWRRAGDLAAEGRLEAAAAELTRLLERGDLPRVAAANLHAERALLRCRLGALEQALADVERALALEPEQVDALTARAHIRSSQGDPHGALADLSRALELEPGAAPRLYNRGNLLAQLGRDEEARADLTRAIEVDPSLALAWWKRGGVELRRGRPEEALSDLERALSLDPHLVDAWRDLMYAHVARGALQEALAAADRAVELAPERWRTWNDRGTVREALADVDGAAGDYARAAELAPQEPVSWFNLGKVHLTRRDLPAAEAAYSRAIALDPGFAEAWANRALTRQRLGQLEPALADCERALALEPDGLLPLRTRGLIRAALGRVDAARADLERYLGLAPDVTASDDHVREVLTQLEAR